VRWWLRIVVTLCLAPLLWQLTRLYIASAQGGLPALPEVLLGTLRIYLLYTLPALAMIAVLLLPADRLLAHLGANLLIVIVAPVLAGLVPVLLSTVIDSPRLHVAGLEALALIYGLVFGLTVRERRRGIDAAAPVEPIREPMRLNDEERT